jgi:hypothetical protein
MQEHIVDFTCPDKFKGHKCAIHIELNCNTSNNEKRGWNFEGFALSFNNEANTKQRAFFAHTW